MNVRPQSAVAGLEPAGDAARALRPSSGTARARRARLRAALQLAHGALDGAVVGATALAADTPVLAALVAALLTWSVFGALSLYRIRTLATVWGTLESLGIGVVLLALASFGAEMLVSGAFADRAVPFTALFAVSLATARLAALPLARALASRLPMRTVVLLGGDASRDDADVAARALGPEARLVGVHRLGRDSLGDDEVRSALVRLAKHGTVDRIVVVAGDAGRDALVRTMYEIVDAGAEVVGFSREFSVLDGRVPTRILDGAPALRLAPTQIRGVNAAAKRAMDVLGASLAIALFAPVLLGIALIVKLSSPGPVLYKQTRVGRDGRPFTFLKFRSMIAGAPSTVHRAYVKAWIQGEAAGTDASGKAVFKVTDDPRITRVGRFLRRTSLDELPQLFNVLRGEMSLVGPRPCMPYERELFEDWQMRRLDVTPGCTGLWQVTARSTVGFRDMALLDLHYISNWSLARDVKLVALTIPVMMFGEGGL